MERHMPVPSFSQIENVTMHGVIVDLGTSVCSLILSRAVFWDCKSGQLLPP